MEVIQNSENIFTNDFSKYDVVGFHSTSSLACNRIETNGFLPDKIFCQLDHDRLITIARKQKIDTGWYEQWLNLRSVTFTREQCDALKHIKQGSAGGQGIKNISDILTGINCAEVSEDANFLGMLEERCEAIRSAKPVVYAVDLSNLGQRLDSDRIQPFYYFRWNPELPLPLVSEILPSRIIAKLNVQL